MRKIAALGFFALTLSIISSQAIAGKVPVCEAQKDELASLGLYGRTGEFGSLWPL
jgi:hypothetical protein